MTKILHYNDGSDNPPRLRIQQSLWALGRLPMNGSVEWTLTEKLAHVKEAGFEAVECWLSDATEMEHYEALQAAGLNLVLGHRPYKLQDVQNEVDRALRLNADFLFMQPADSFTPLEDVVTMVKEGMAYASEHGNVCFVETHRSNFTENLPQTLQLIDAVPEIAITADLSHFVVVGEFYGWKEERAVDRMLPVLEHTAHIHGRISNGEAVQVDVADGSGETAQFFVRLWSTAMRAWQRTAVAGDIFPFTSELGPPRYAITLPDGREFSDRWEQSFVMASLAKQAWKLASSDSTI